MGDIMYSSDIMKIELSCAKSKSVPGFRRHALYSKHKYGVTAGDFSSNVRFGFVVYNPGNHNVLEKVRIEIKLCVGDDETLRLEDIDPKVIRKVVDSLPPSECVLKQSFVEDGDTFYFRGSARYLSPNSVSSILLCSMAARFLNLYGDVLATMLLGIPTVNTTMDAMEVNDLLISVDAFLREMRSVWGTVSFGRIQAQEKYNRLAETLAKNEEEMNQFYHSVQHCIEVLSEYGINERDINFT